MPWVPELFSAPAPQRLEDKLRGDGRYTVPYFDGVMAGELGPLVESFAGEPELHDPRLRESDVIGECQRALAAGDVEARARRRRAPPQGVGPPPGLLRGPVLERRRHPAAALRADHDGRWCALEYNVVRWGRTELRPQAGLAVYVRGQSGELAAARIYDDVDPPLAPRVGWR